MSALGYGLRCCSAPCRERDDEAGNPTWMPYVGFTVVNASLFDITVTHIDLELGIPMANKGVVTPAIWLQPARGYGDSKLSDVSLAASPSTRGELSRVCTKRATLSRR